MSVRSLSLEQVRLLCKAAGQGGTLTSFITIDDNDEQAAEFMAIKGLEEAGLVVQTRRDSDLSDSWAEAEWALTVAGNMAATRAASSSTQALHPAQAKSVADVGQ
jgi:hypothetical protein